MKLNKHVTTKQSYKTFQRTASLTKLTSVKISTELASYLRNKILLLETNINK